MTSQITNEILISSTKKWEGPKIGVHTKSCQISKMVLLAKIVNPLSANPTKWSDTLKQFVGKLQTNCLSVFDHFVGMALKGLTAENS